MFSIIVTVIHVKIKYSFVANYDFAVKSRVISPSENPPLVWYCSQFAMQNIVLLNLTLINMEVQTTVAS